MNYFLRYDPVILCSSIVTAFQEKSPSSSSVLCKYILHLHLNKNIKNIIVMEMFLTDQCLCILLL